jgi:hypothetical protein
MPLGLTIGAIALLIAVLNFLLVEPIKGFPVKQCVATAIDDMSETLSLPGHIPMDASPFFDSVPIPSLHI